MFADIFYSFRNSILRIVMMFPPLWWSILKFSNQHFMCSVVGIIRDNQNRILLLDHKYRPDPLAFPAGWLKNGESPLEAIKREIKEETNFNVRPIRLLSIGSSKRYSHLEFVVEALYIDGEFIPSNEVGNYSWVNPEEVSESLNSLVCTINQDGISNQNNIVSEYSCNIL
ncbi:MAG: NUDIX hydrolase [Melioribacteraceae bacterium]|nr:NUDIX hydrolase [Melioribacteraceae bacterium]